MEAYLCHEGIDLDGESAMCNEGLKTVAKTILNSLWGNFGQNENNVHIQYVKLYCELLALTKNVHYETSFDFVSRVATTLKDTIIQPLKTGNIIASFVTCYACLKFFSVLEKVGKRVLYYDTDSVIYSWKEGETKFWEN